MKSLRYADLETDIAAALAVILGHEVVELLPAQHGLRIPGQRGLEKPRGQRVFAKRPPGEHVELPLDADDAPCCLAKLVGRRVPPGHETEHLRGLTVEILEDTAKEL